MASTKDYLDYILELLSNIDNVSYKKMMGEYLLYKDDVLFGGIYDNRFLIKKATSLKDDNLEEAIPYNGAKPMLLVDRDDPDEVAELVMKVVNDLRK